MPLNEPQFTPGPWRKERCELETSNGDPWCGRFIVKGPPSRDGRYCEEDASLIAAAPDLYKALSELLTRAPLTDEELAARCRLGRAALAKVEERQ